MAAGCKVTRSPGEGYQVGGSSVKSAYIYDFTLKLSHPGDKLKGKCPHF